MGDARPAPTARRAQSDDHRARLLQGMARSVADKGYADTTIADIVRIAGVSRRTFYEHFVGKADCLLALFSAASRRALGVLEQAIDPSQDWRVQVPRVLRAYLECLGENPLLLRTLFIEILSLGEAGLRVRRQANNEIAGFLQRRLSAARPPEAPGRFDEFTATALVGAVHELVLQAIEEGRTARLRELAEPASRIVLALADAQQPA